jgi:hypothetical protein
MHMHMCMHMCIWNSIAAEHLNIIPLRLLFIQTVDQWGGVAGGLLTVVVPASRSVAVGTIFSILYKVRY